MKKVCSVALMCLLGLSAYAAEDLVPLKLDLPDKAFEGTPADVDVGPDVEPMSKTERPPMMVPSGLANVAKGAKVTSSDKNADAESLGKVIDANKRSSEDAIINLRKGTQWVQLDFGDTKEVFAIVIWHAHNLGKVYRDVIVQISDDPEFAKDVKTLFNNDKDNSSALGAGTNREYWETREGKLIDAKGEKGRYLRCYSKGSTASALNEYTEIEVYGRPAVK